MWHFGSKSSETFVLSSNRITYNSSHSNCPTLLLLSCFIFFPFYPLSSPSVFHKEHTSKTIRYFRENKTKQNRTHVQPPKQIKKKPQAPLTSLWRIVITMTFTSDNTLLWTQQKPYLLLHQRCSESITSWLTYKFVHIVKLFFLNYHVCGCGHSQNN